MSFKIFGLNISGLFRAVSFFLISLVAVNFISPAGIDATSEMEPAERYEQRAKKLAESYEYNYFHKDSHMLNANNNYRFTASGNWDVTALLTMYTKLAHLDSDYLEDCDAAITALTYYGKEIDGEFAGFSDSWAETPFGSTSGVCYDDNMWVGRDLVSLYELSGDSRYLYMASQIADYLIADAWQELDEDMFANYFGTTSGGALGGFYWSSDKVALHTCSTAPASQFLAALSRVADNGKNEEYLEYAIKTYRFFKYLENDNGVFYDYISFHRDDERNITGIAGIDKSVFSYNTGSPITAAIELYIITGEEQYLEDAKYWAASADAYFAKDSELEGLKTYKDLTWFREVLLHGYVALYPFDDSALDYIQNMENSINYAYDNHRLKGFMGYNENHMPKDWIAGFADDDEKKRGYTLEQFPCAGIYASLAKLYQDISG